DRRLVVREGDEPGLELRRGRVDPALQQAPAEAAVRVDVAGRRAGEVGDGRIAEEDGEEPGLRRDLDGATADGISKAARKERGELAQAFVGAGAEVLEGGQSRGHRQRVAGQRARLV